MSSTASGARSPGSTTSPTRAFKRAEKVLRDGAGGERHGRGDRAPRQRRDDDQRARAPGDRRAARRHPAADGPAWSGSASGCRCSSAARATARCSTGRPMCARWGVARPGRPPCRLKDPPADGVRDRAVAAQVQRRLDRWPPARAVIAGYERKLVLGMATESWHVRLAVAGGGEAACADEVPFYAQWLAVHRGGAAGRPRSRGPPPARPSTGPRRRTSTPPAAAACSTIRRRPAASPRPPRRSGSPTVPRWTPPRVRALPPTDLGAIEGVHARDMGRDRGGHPPRPRRTRRPRRLRPAPRRPRPAAGARSRPAWNARHDERLARRRGVRRRRGSGEEAPINGARHRWSSSYGAAPRPTCAPGRRCRRQGARGARRGRSGRRPARASRPRRRRGAPAPGRPRRGSGGRRRGGRARRSAAGGSGAGRRSPAAQPPTKHDAAARRAAPRPRRATPPGGRRPRTRRRGRRAARPSSRRAPRPARGARGGGRPA